MNIKKNLGKLFSNISYKIDHFENKEW